MQTGNMQQDYVIKVLQQLNVPTAELFFHPSLEETRQKLGPNQGDLSTLLSPSVRRQIHEEGLELSTYPQIYTETQSAFAPS